MNVLWSHTARGLVARIGVLLALTAGCGAEGNHSDADGSDADAAPDPDDEHDGGSQGRLDDGAVDPLDGADASDLLDGAMNGDPIDALTLNPTAVTLRVSGAAPQTYTFAALGSLGTSAPHAVAASFEIDSADVGDIDPVTGVFTSNNLAGGVVTVTATYQGMTATATLTVVLALEEAVGTGLPEDPGALFDPANTTIVKDDPTHTPSLVYPVAQTMFPQNLAHVLFQWRAAGAKLFQLAFHSDVLDYQIYTDGVEDTCTQAGTQVACWQSDEAAWRRLARSNAGHSVSLTLRATDPAHPGTVYEGAAVTLFFSKSPVPGAIYYWSTTAKGIRRGRMEDLAPTNFLTPTEADGNCVACHTLSRNGKAMAADVGGENLWVVEVTQDVPPPRRFTQYQNKNIGSSWATFNPDTTRIISSKGGVLTLRDGASGAPIGANSGVISLDKNLATMPDWAPDGGRVVFAMGAGAKGRKATAASIAQISVTGDTFGAPEVIVASQGGSDDNSWPMFDPSSQWIAFVKSTSSSEKDPTAQIHVVKAQASASPQALTRANTLVNDTSIETGLFNNMPTWAPSEDDGLAWVAFTSTRDYGMVLADGSTYGKQLRQMWIAAVDMSKLGQGDPSYPAFHVPFQELTENSHRPFWAEDALVPEGDAGVPLDAGSPAVDAGSADAGDAGTGDAGTGDAGPPACIAADQDCSSGTCCAGLVCAPTSDTSYQCMVELL